LERVLQGNKAMSGGYSRNVQVSESFVRLFIVIELLIISDQLFLLCVLCV